MRRIFILFLSFCFAVATPVASAKTRQKLPMKVDRNSLVKTDQSRRGKICRLLMGPERKLPMAQQTQAESSELLDMKLLDRHTVPFELLKAMEFQLPILNSRWFHSKLREKLEANGLVALNWVEQETVPEKTNSKGKITQERQTKLVINNKKKVVKSFGLLPSIIEYQGAEIAESLWGDIKELFELDEPSTTPAKLGEMSSASGLTVPEVEALRKFLMTNLYREKELINTIQLTLPKGAVIVREEMHLQTTSASEWAVAGMATSAVTVPWFLHSAWEYLSNLSAIKNAFPELGIGLGDSLNYIEGQGYMLNGERLGRSDFSSFLYDEFGRGEWWYNSVMNIPDVSGSLMFFSVAVLAWNFPRFFKGTSDGYRNWIRNKALEKYRALLSIRAPRPEGGARLESGTVIDGTAEDITATHVMPAIPDYQFKSIDDIAETLQAAEELPMQLGEDSVLADIRILDRDTGHLNRQMLAAYQQDMVEWKMVAEYYKRNMSERFHSMDTTNGELQTLISEYRERLTELTRRIEMYESLMGEIQGKVDGLIAQLQMISGSNDELNRQLNKVTDRNRARYKKEISDALAGLTFFREQTLDLAERAISNTMDTIGDENKDLTDMQRRLDNLTLNAAVSQSVKASMQSIVTSFVSRSVTDESLDGEK